MRRKWLSFVLCGITAVSVLPFQVFAQNFDMTQEEVNPTGKVKAEFEVDADYMNDMGYDLIVSIPLSISLTYNSGEDVAAFQGSDEVYAYGLANAGSMVKVEVNKGHASYGELIGPAMETYDISNTVEETIAGNESVTYSAELCYENLLAKKGMEGKTEEDLQKSKLEVVVYGDSFIPKYSGQFYTSVPLTISMEDASVGRSVPGVYGKDGVSFVTWDRLIENAGIYENSYSNTSTNDFSVFYLEDNGSGYTLTSNYKPIYTYLVDGTEVKTTTPEEQYLIEGQYSVNQYNLSTAYMNEVYDGIQGELVVSKNISIIGQHAFDSFTTFGSIVLPESITTIECYAFANHWLPFTVTLSSGITSIEDNAFYTCSGLTDIYFDGTEQEWNQISIGEIGNEILETVTIHYNETE